MKTMLLIFFCFAMEFSFGAYLPSLPPEDSTVPQKAYKMEKKGFLERYGRDDSSKALIYFYFRKRKVNKNIFFPGAALGLAAGIGYFPVNNLPDIGEFNTADYKGGNKIFLVLGIFCLAAAGIPLLLVGGSLWMHYSRKKLLKLLNDHFNGRSIPAGIARNKSFKYYLEHSK
jgi:hypothetical protein